MSAEAADSLRSEVVKTIRRQRQIKQNLSHGERKALQNLKRNKDIMILGADKGRATVILNKADYRKKILDLLNDVDT